MTLKCNPEQIKNLALHPIRSAPNALDRGENRVLPRQFHLQHTSVPMLIGEKMIDDFDPVLVIDPGLVTEAINRGVRVVSQEAAHVDNSGGVDHRKPVKFSTGFQNLSREALL